MMIEGSEPKILPRHGPAQPCLQLRHGIHRAPEAPCLGRVLLGVITVGGVKDDGDGCLVKVLLQKSGEGVDIDGA